MKVLVSASLLACDKEKIVSEVASLEKKNVDLVHFDVMDGKFVNNISFNEKDDFSKIRKYSSLPFEVHLMVENPDDYLERYNFSSQDVIIVHYESFKNEDELIACLKKIKLNHRAGITFKPNTMIAKVDNLLKLVDYVLVMSVEPGFGGQVFLEQALERIKFFKEKQQNYHYVIEVDGGINDITSKKCLAAGVDILVSGSYLFKGNMIERANILKCEK